MLPFVNREKEIEIVANAFDHNLSTSTTQLNTNKLQLVVTCQMLGSGKTTLGYRFLEAVKRDQENLKKSIGQAGITQLLSLKYVLVDFRFTKWPTDKNASEEVWEIHFKLLLARCICNALNPGAEKSNRLAKQVIRTTLLEDLIDTLIGEKTILFFHFDEIDLWQSHAGDAPRSFYHLWAAIILEIQRLGHVIYCSGRSPYLFLVGKQYFKHRSEEQGGLLTSPEKGEVIHITLPPFTKENILTLLDHQQIKRNLESFPPRKEHMLNIDKKAKDSTAESILKLTAGVPRLVSFAIEYLSLLSEKFFPAALEQKKIEKKLTGKPFTEWAGKRGPAEVAPYKETLPAKWDMLYLDFIVIAALRIPISPDLKLTIPELGLKDEPALEILQRLCLYVTKDNESMFVIYPQVVLNLLAWTPPQNQKERTNVFLSCAYTTFSNDGMALERALKICFELRMKRYYLFLFLILYLFHQLI